MKMNKTSKIIFVAALLLAGFMGCGAFAQQYTETQGDLATLGTNINKYIGVYYAIAKMTNSINGTFNVQPPANTTNGTFKDTSGFTVPPYASSLVVYCRNTAQTWHTNNNNSLTFTATNTMTYTLTAFVNSSLPPPTNGQTITLQVQWNTNSP